MLKKILKNISNGTYIGAVRTIFAKYFWKRWENIDLTEEHRQHLNNIITLILSYFIVSVFVYPDIGLKKFLTEAFSLLCIYMAIFMWFMDRITEDLYYRFLICVTACTAPVLFVHNTFSVSLVAILLMISFEFIILKYLCGCKLFDDAVPAYIIFDGERDADGITNFLNGYKILGKVFLSSNGSGSGQFRSVDELRKWLTKINKIAFFPMPRKLLYFSRKINVDNLLNLMELSSELSVPFFKVTIGAIDRKNIATVSPVTLLDFEVANVTAQEKNSLSSVFKDKHVWVCYDGRDSVMDMICAILSVSSVDLVVLCETEGLFIEAEQELRRRCSNDNYKIKIVGLEMMCASNVKPDILFYNMPIKFVDCSENNLKEAVIKNVIGMGRLIKFVHRIGLPYVFVLSNMESLNANNWIGATQRIGELMAQFADFRSRKLHSKFRVIRVPNGATDDFGIFGKMVSSMKLTGRINVSFSDSSTTKLYYRKDILPLLIKILVSSLNEYDFSSSVYTLIPKNCVLPDDLIKIICNLFSLRKDIDVKITRDEELGNMDLEDFPNITETLEKTSINGVVRTKFSNHNLSSYETPDLTMEQVNLMKTRELISWVFQSLNEKISK